VPPGTTNLLTATASKWPKSRHVVIVVAVVEVVLVLVLVLVAVVVGKREVTLFL